MTQSEQPLVQPKVALEEIRLQDGDGREFLFVGAGAIGLDSRERLNHLIEEERPDTVE